MGCTGSGSGPAPRPSALTSAGTPTAASLSASPPAAATTGAAGTEITATDKDNGRTVTLGRGRRVRIVLSSTYWHFQGSSDPAVLRIDGQPRVSPQPSGCVPGAGCGTATATYLAVAAGDAVITATRTSCGEAMGCTGGNDRYSLRVVVD
jgi:hypothetical protein